MALTTAELVSGLFGFWSSKLHMGFLHGWAAAEIHSATVGLAIWLFVPEFVDVWRHPMPESERNSAPLPRSETQSDPFRIHPQSISRALYSLLRGLSVSLGSPRARR